MIYVATRIGGGRVCGWAAHVLAADATDNRRQVEETRMAQVLAQVHQGDGRHPRSASVARPLTEGKRATVAPGGWLRDNLERRKARSTHSERRGADIRKIQALLGHSKLETTARYTRVATGMISNVASPLDDLSAARAKREKRGKDKNGPKSS